MSIWLGMIPLYTLANEVVVGDVTDCAKPLLAPIRHAAPLTKLLVMALSHLPHLVVRNVVEVMLEGQKK
jgi:hypothetical protein